MCLCVSVARAAFFDNIKAKIAKPETNDLSELFFKEYFSNKLLCPRTFVNGSNKTFKKIPHTVDTESLCVCG